MANHRWTRLLPQALSKGTGYAFESLNPSPLSTIGEPHNRRQTKQALVLTAWHYISNLSPFVCLFLIYALTRKREVTLQLPDVFNPYAVRARPLNFDTSFEKVCQHRTAPILVNKKPLTFEERISNFELPLDRHLTSAQCDAIFPGLYLEADRARDFYVAKGGVKLSDLDDAEELGQARAQIINQRLYVTFYGQEQQGTRTMAALAAINEALVTSLEPLPDVEFVLQTGDNGLAKGAPWVLGRKEEEESLVLMPDYGFNSWPEPRVGSFIEVQDKTLLYESQLKWKDKIPKIFWRGAFMISLRKELYEIAKKYQWGAVSDLDWEDKTDGRSAVLTPEEHCQFKFLAHAEGWGYSGRLKYLQQCRSVVIAHKMKYIQHFHHLFNSDSTSPSQNIVILPGHNFDELPAAMDKLLRDDDLAERIANNGFAFYHHWLSPASTNCYWRR